MSGRVNFNWAGTARAIRSEAAKAAARDVPAGVGGAAAAGEAGAARVITGGVREAGAMRNSARSAATSAARLAISRHPAGAVALRAAPVAMALLPIVAGAAIGAVGSGLIVSKVIGSDTAQDNTTKQATDALIGHFTAGAIAGAAGLTAAVGTKAGLMRGVLTGVAAGAVVTNLPLPDLIPDIPFLPDLF